MEEIIIFGSSGHAGVIADIIEVEARYKIKGFIGIKSDKILNYPVLGNDDYLIKLTNKVNLGIIGVGDNFLRQKIVNKIHSIMPFFQFINAIHPSAIIAKDAILGTGIAIMANVIIGTNAHIGNHCIINTGSIIEHDNQISDFASIAPGVVLGGNVNIGKNSAICMGANIIHKISIGDNTVIGAGSLVLTNINSNILAYGSPAKVIKTIDYGYKYL